MVPLVLKSLKSLRSSLCKVRWLPSVHIKHLMAPGSANLSTVSRVTWCRHPADGCHVRDRPVQNLWKRHERLHGRRSAMCCFCCSRCRHRVPLCAPQCTSSKMALRSGSCSCSAPFKCTLMSMLKAAYHLPDNRACCVACQTLQAACDACGSSPSLQPAQSLLWTRLPMGPTSHCICCSAAACPKDTAHLSISPRKLASSSILQDSVFLLCSQGA